MFVECSENSLWLCLLYIVLEFFRFVIEFVLLFWDIIIDKVKVKVVMLVSKVIVIIVVEINISCWIKIVFDWEVFFVDCFFFVLVFWILFL